MERINVESHKTVLS